MEFVMDEISNFARIFKRDQRTIKNRKESENTLHIKMDTFQVEFCDDCKNESRGTKRHNFTISRFLVMFFRISNLGMEAVTRSHLRTSGPNCRKNRNRINPNDLIKRLVQVFVFGVSLVTIVRAPTAMSAPTSCRDRDRAEWPIPKWENPCGEELCYENYSGSTSSGESDRDIIVPILTAARVALDHMHNFKENYTQETFQVSFSMYLNVSGNFDHPWLPNKKTDVPKRVGEQVDIAHLESQKFDKFLQNIYKYMQMYAVGIEQVVWDQQETNGLFRGEFVETESNLRKLLCELRTAMYNKNIEPHKVERCIMDNQTRMIKETAQRNLRDWVIFRESLNGLEYLIQALEYFETMSPS